MRGVSWGGFSTSQAAALAPPALKAIMPMCASDMRYTDDAHYVGGAVAVTGLKWATSMKVVMAAPPDPQVTGEAWRDEWKRRLDATPAITARQFHLGQGGLHDTPQQSETAHVDGSRIVGLGKVEWVPFAPTELPREQSPDDARSVVFDTPPLPAAVEVLGAGALRVRVSSDQPVAHLAIRICEVTPTGQSWLVTYGLLNLTHRDGHGHPVALESGRAYYVEIPLNFTAHRFPPGSRIRAAVSGGLWPLVWSSPTTAPLTLDLAISRLDLPVGAVPAVEAPMPIALAPALPDDPKGWPAMEISQTANEVRIIETWPMSSSVVLSIAPGDPLSCAWRAEQSARYQRPGWDAAIESSVWVRSDASAFVIEGRLRVPVNGETVADVKHQATIARVLA